MFTYPVHQAADILFCKGELVPVGRDQLPHLELTRTIARRFAERYGAVFPLPEALLGDGAGAARAGRTQDGQEPGNAIALSDDRDDDRERRSARRAPTAERTITYEPERRPEVANLLTHRRPVFRGARRRRSPPRSARRGGAAEATAIEAVDGLLAPIRERRAADRRRRCRRRAPRGREDRDGDR